MLISGMAEGSQNGGFGLPEASWTWRGCSSQAWPRAVRMEDLACPRRRGPGGDAHLRHGRGQSEWRIWLARGVVDLEGMLISGMAEGSQNGGFGLPEASWTWRG